MREQNGIRIFEEGDELPDLPAGLSVDRVLSPFGYKIVKVDNKPMWMVATEQDYRESEAKRLGISPDEVEVKAFSGEPGERWCANSGPSHCTGSCPSPQSCSLLYNPNTQIYYCRCI